MDKKMLINAVHPEECRIAITENGVLSELEIESYAGRKLKGNIYKARVARVEPSLQAAFVEIGAERNGFLQINDIHPTYFRQPISDEILNHPYRARIQDVLTPGQELVVQVVKEERELKGATLTTYVSLPGRYVVLMPGSDRGGVSRKIGEVDQRRRLKKLSAELEIPTGMGMIVRTAGLDRSLADLSRDLSLQLKLWERILSGAQNASCPTLLYQDSDLATRVIRDYFTPEIREIIIDHAPTYERVKEFIGEVMPRYRSRVKLFDEETPLFTNFSIDEQVATTFSREVQLRSGGAIVIESLEALVAIDVNSGKATNEESIEETAYKTNMEAAEEVARQLRLRDLGGLIVIDFIDMVDRRHKANVEKRLKDAVESDKARIELGRLSKFGLVEMSRQRLHGPLSSQSHSTCAHCQGHGVIKNPDLVALDVLRKLQGAVIAGNRKLIKVRLSPAPALMLLNNKKAELARLEAKYGTEIYILADGRLRTDEYELSMESPRAPVQESSADRRPEASSGSRGENKRLDQRGDSRGRGRRSSRGRGRGRAQKKP